MKIKIREIKTRDELNLQKLKQEILTTYQNYISKINGKKVDGYQPFEGLSLNIRFKDNQMKIDAKGLDNYLYALTTTIKELGWKAEYGIEDMCRDGYNYVIKQNEREEK